MSLKSIKIVGWDMLSPFGELNIFQQACREKKTLNDINPQLQCQSGVLKVPNFDVRESLGRKGTRNFDRNTGLLVKTLSNVIDAIHLETNQLHESGLINGTAMGSVSSTLEFLMDTYRHDKPYFVNPAHMPNTVINCAAGQSAIWHKMKGPNTTLSAGSQSFHAVIRMAQRYLQRGYSEYIFASAVEEIEKHTETLYRTYSEKNDITSSLAEGSAVFALALADEENEKADQIFETKICSLVEGIGIKQQINSIVQQILNNSQLTNENISQFVFDETLESFRRSSEPLVRDILPNASHLNITALFGIGFSMNGAYQLSTLLSSLSAEEYGIMLSITDVSLACSLVKKGKV